MVQLEMSNMYTDVGVNNGSEKWTGKKKHCGLLMSISMYKAHGNIRYIFYLKMAFYS